jgi:PadR family transcriptional regulator PadR
VKKKSDVLQGTMDLLILKTLTLEPMHGYGIAQRLEQITNGVFKVNAGTLFPAVYRLEEQGFIEGDWASSENNRRARYYRLTKSGHRQLAAEKRNWETIAMAIRTVLES